MPLTLWNLTRPGTRTKITTFRIWGYSHWACKKAKGNGNRINAMSYRQPHPTPLLWLRTNLNSGVRKNNNTTAIDFEQVLWMNVSHLHIKDGDKEIQFASWIKELNKNSTGTVPAPITHSPASTPCLTNSIQLPTSSISTWLLSPASGIFHWICESGQLVCSKVPVYNFKASLMHFRLRIALDRCNL